MLFMMCIVIEHNRVYNCGMHDFRMLDTYERDTYKREITSQYFCAQLGCGEWFRKVRVSV